MTRGRLLSLAIAMLATACTNRMEPVGSSPSRTYSTHVQPALLGAKSQCNDCHKKEIGQELGSLGTYSYDRAQRATIRHMVQNEGKGFLSAQQIQDVVDWTNAGGPEDSTPF